MSDSLLVLDRVEKRFPGFTAVAGIDLEILAGEFVAIMGPSGCGKTTTLRMIAGLETPTAGEIRLRGRRLNDVRPWDRDTPLVWQNLALFPFMTVRQNVEFGLKMRGVGAADRHKRATEWLERLGIAEFADRPVELLSGGQRQRVALARALVTQPEILLLDEPLSALDAHLVIRMQAELAQLQKQLGITFVYVTHSQSEAFAMANRVVIMNNGKIEQIGTPREVYRAPASRFVAEFIGANNILPGTVQAIEGENLAVATRQGSFTARQPQGVALGSGDRVMLVVSADRVALSNRPPADGNRLSGRIIGEEFVGAIVTIHVDIAEGVAFKIQRQQRDLEALDLDRGSEIHLSWDPADSYLLPER
jgi:spermidine/putrescine transport system ATP-binding protein